MFDFLKKKKKTFSFIKRSKHPEEYLNKIKSVLTDGFWDILSVPFNFPIQNTIPIFWGEDDYPLARSFTKDHFDEEMKPKSFKIISDLMDYYKDEDINFSYLAFDKKEFIKDKNSCITVIKKKKWNNKSVNLLYQEGISSAFGPILIFGGSGDWAMVLEPEDDFGYFGSRDINGVKIFLDIISSKEGYFRIICEKLLEENDFDAEIINHNSKQRVNLWKSWLKNQIEYLKKL